MANRLQSSETYISPCMKINGLVVNCAFRMPWNTIQTEAVKARVVFHSSGRSTRVLGEYLMGLQRGMSTVNYHVLMSQTMQ